MLTHQLDTMSDPTTTTEALALAEAARSRCDHPTAEKWGLRAAHLADLEGDKLTTCKARQLGAWAMYEQGQPGRGVRILRRAQSLVEAFPSLEERRGMVYHDLYSLNLMAGALHTAEGYFDRAVAFYGQGNGTPVRLAVDRAWGLLASDRAEEAATCYRSILERAEDESVRLTIRANLACALAVCGARKEAREAVRVLRRDLQEERWCGAAWGWYSLARALAVLGEDRRGARSAASRARRVAAANGEEATRAAAATLLAELHGA